METYISLLRGINVSGQKKILMTELKLLYEKIAFTKVRTYIQSGNVIFSIAKKKDSKELAGMIAIALFEKYGFEVPVLVFTKKEIEEIVSHNPFLADEQKDRDKMHVTLLESLPGQEEINSLAGIESSPDLFSRVGKAVYLFCPNGYGNTKLNNNFFEKKLKQKATTRNWKTMTILNELASD
jgi:uncharacterized protein (DUF1697 family)